jgi:hypothetical protein
VISLFGCVAKLGVGGVERNALVRVFNAPNNVGFH